MYAGGYGELCTAAGLLLSLCCVAGGTVVGATVVGAGAPGAVGLVGLVRLGGMVGVGQKSCEEGRRRERAEVVFYMCLQGVDSGESARPDRSRYTTSPSFWKHLELRKACSRNSRAVELFAGTTLPLLVSAQVMEIRSRSKPHTNHVRPEGYTKKLTL